jgi:hypothetical protein
VADQKPNPVVVAAWTDALVAGDVAPLKAVFQSHGARGPEVIWNPQMDDLRHAPLRFLLQHWRDLAAGRPMPRASQIDALALVPALGHVGLVDVVDGGADFHHRLYGTHVAAVSGFEMTGRSVSEFKASVYIVEYYLAGYRAIYRRGEPLYTEHGPPATVMTSAWHRLALPLADADGAIVRVLTANVPIDPRGNVVRK